LGTLLALSPDEQSAFQRAAASFEASSSSLNKNQQEFLQIVLGGDLWAAPPD
jgi:hypothetical protein